MPKFDRFFLQVSYKLDLLKSVVCVKITTSKFQRNLILLLIKLCFLCA
jgi:hypothetical protein